ncbi:MAG: cytochrome b/b6 domain-containing protein [Pseudomonadota bacterium]
MAAPHPAFTTPRRPALVIALHWLTLAALLLGVVLILVRDGVDGRILRGWLLEGHRHLGLLVLGLLLARLAVRLLRHRLAAIGAHSLAARAAAAAVHVALYLLLAAVPMLGWTLSNAHGQEPHFLGLPLPTLVAADDDLADTLQLWHARAAWTLLILGLVHALAALWHHFIRRDAVLAAMLPFRRNSAISAEDSLAP